MNKLYHSKLKGSNRIISLPDRPPYINIPPLILESEYFWQHGVVIILDALGTKGVWKSGDGLEYVKILNRIHRQNLWLFDRLKKMFPNALESALTNQFFSDSLIITFQLNEDIASNTGMNMMPIGRMIDGIFASFFNNHILVRGAVSVGKYACSSGVLVGPAVDDAAEYHDKMNMAGVVATPSLSLILDSHLLNHNRLILNNEENYPDENHWIRYPVPFKNSSKSDLHVINWPFTVKYSLAKIGQYNPNPMLADMLSHNSIPFEAREKISNTIEFAKFSFSQDYFGMPSST